MQTLKLLVNLEVGLEGHALSTRDSVRRQPLHRDTLIASLVTPLPFESETRGHTIVQEILSDSTRMYAQSGMASSGSDGIAVPPAHLRLRVHGSEDENAFLGVGSTCAKNIREALLQHYRRDVFSFEKVLDFGCGCGRTLRWFENHPQSCRFFGTDIDKEAIAWCESNIAFAQFDVNDISPPLAYPPATFDMIYAVSVLTHLSEADQLKWLWELRRVARPGALLILTTHGEYAAELAKLESTTLSELKRCGFLFLPASTLAGDLPVEFYQKSVSFQTKNQVMRTWRGLFEIVAYLERGLNNHQDLVILIKTT